MSPRIRLGHPPQQRRHRTLALLLFYLFTLTTVTGSLPPAAPVAAQTSATLKLQYRTDTTNPADGEITPFLQIVNAGTSSVALSELKIRYWYSVDGDAAQTYECYFSLVNCANVTASFTKLTTPRTNADSYLELGLTSAAGSLNAGSSLEIKGRIHKNNWVSYNESNDYSYDSTKLAYADWTKITLYRNGVLVWGVEPSGSGDVAFKLQYRTDTTNPADGEITPFVQIANSGSTSVPLSELTARYWFTVDGDTPQSYTCYYAPFGCANVSAQLVKLSSPVTGADYYLQLSFSAAAGSVGASTPNLEIKSRINKNNWASYNESNDYSYDSTKLAYADWTKVTLYRNGVLVWGIEPGGVTPPPTNTPTARPTNTATPTSAPTATPTSAPAPTATPAAASDTQPPSVPANVRATAQTDTTITLAWDAATDNVGVTAYEVYSGTTLVGTTSASGLVVDQLTAATSYTFTVRARDAAGNRSAASAALSASTAAAPDTIVPSAPAGLRATGSTDTSVSLAWNAATDNVGVTTYEVYSGAELRATVPTLTATISGLTPNTISSFTVRARDAAGNRSEPGAALAVRTSDGVVPAAPTNLRLLGRSDTTIALAWNPASDAAGVVGYEVYSGTTLLGTTTGLSYAARGLTAATSYSFTMRARDTVGNRSLASTALSATTLVADRLPDDPALIAPPSDQTVVSDLFRDTAFLYTGPNPIQTGVAAGAIEERRVAVLRGRVLNRAGSPISGVIVSIQGQANFGQTLTRADGAFDLAVNGGGQLVVNYSRSGYLPVQRAIEAEWRDYAWLPDVVLIPLDTAVTSVTMGAAAMQVARANTVTDADGTRRATLLFPVGTSATMTLPDGSTQPLSTLAVRATEYTVGSNGTQAMPGSLPDSSGYTYAIELSVDQAISANATDVRFSQPVVFYLENFIGFPAGTAVPIGSYDRAAAAWLPAPNGQIVTVVSISGGLASLDIDGDNLADDASGLGVTSAERQQLASLYTAGQSLWRVPIEHFTPWDCNWPYGPPDNAEPPPPIPPDPGCEDPCQRAGSIIDVENQVLGEEIGVVGTQLSLIYNSDQQPGRSTDRSVEVPLRGSGSLPPTVKRVDVNVQVAGRYLTQSFSTTSPNQRYTFTWDGKDGYGRPLQGPQPIKVSVSYVYQAVYRAPAQFTQSFARFGTTPISGNRSTSELSLSSETLPRTTVGVLDTQAQVRMGGWGIDMQHTYDPNNRTLQSGDGTVRGGGNTDLGTGGGVSTLSGALTTVAGSSAYGFSGDGGPATAATFNDASGIGLAPDGSLYIADAANNRIRRVAPNGTITTVAGNGSYGFSGDGGPAAAASLAYPRDVVVAPDGSLYIADTANNRIRRVAPNGTITTVAGNGSYGFSGDGGPATAASLASPHGLALSRDGSLYIADTDNDVIRRVGRDGTIITIVGEACANSYYGCPLGDGGPAANASLRQPEAIAVAPDGSLYIADTNNYRIRRIGVDGVIETYAGGGSMPSTNGVGALSAALNGPREVVVREDGAVYFISGVLAWRVAPDGVLIAVAGGGTLDAAAAQGGWASSIALSSPAGLAIGPDENLYLSDPGDSSIHRIGSVLPGFNAGDLLIGSGDGEAIFRLDRNGRHLETFDGRSPGTVRARYSYDANGRLVGISDVDGLTTRIERDAAGQVTAIVGPYGHRTSYSYDANGYLASITNPVGEVTRFTTSPGGLLTEMTNPRGGRSSFEYDTQGRLTRDTNPAGGGLTLTRVQLANGIEVRATDGAGSTTIYRLEDLSNGDRRRSVITQANNAQTVTLTRADGSTVVTRPDGTTATVAMKADPRFGMQTGYPTTQTIADASGHIFRTVTSSRTVTLSTPGNPLTLQSRTDTLVENGRTTTAVYNATARTLTTTTPSGQSTVVAYDGKMRPTTTQVSSLAATTSVYDSQGRLAELRHGSEAELRVTRVVYNASGFVERVIDPLGATTRFTYDAIGQRLSETWPTGQVLSYAYDANGNVTSSTDPQGVRTNYEYDLHNRLTAKVVDPAGRALRFTMSYDLADNLTRQVDDVGTSRLNLTTSLSYANVAPGSYVIVQSTNPLSETVRLSYTPFGEIASATDALNQTTTMGYTGQGWLQTITTPEGRTTTYAYTDDGQIRRVTDARGSISQFSYDAVTRLASVTAGAAVVSGQPALNQTTSFSYDIHDRLVRITNPRGNTTDVAYDSFSRIIRETDPLTNTIEHAYDGLGRRIRTTVGANVASEALSTLYSYDAIGRVVAERTDPSGLNLLTRYRYSRAGSSDTWNLQEVVDPRGNVTAQSFDTLGMLTSVRDANGQTSSYVYDNLGRRLEQRDPRGSLTSYSYDPLNRMRSLTQNGRTERWDYTTHGLLRQYTDFSGRITSYTYDRDRWMTGIDYPTGTPDVSYSYDAVGNVLSTIDGLGTTTYAYDALNRLISRTRGGRTISYARNLTDRITRIGYWGRGNVDYSYDAADRVTSLTPWGGSPTSYSYRSTDLLKSQTRGNGVATSYSYDTASRLTGMLHARGATSLLDIRYALDRNGNRTEMTDSDGATSYGYDVLDRLTQIGYPAVAGGPGAGSTSYGYDLVGNRTVVNGTTTFSYDTSDRITTPGYSYDANGNLLSDGTTTYSYDAADRLIQTVKGGVTTTYSYDGNGNLARETVNGVTTEFIWDESGALPVLLGEIRSDGTEVTYAHGPEGFAAQRTISGGTAQPIIHPLLDGLGSMHRLTDAAGAVTRSTSYDAFGNVRATSGTATSRLGFTGELTGKIDGTIYLRARHYSPALGRFVQRDSFGGLLDRPQSLNRYSYTENNPSNNVDPSGHLVGESVRPGIFQRAAGGIIRGLGQVGNVVRHIPRALPAAAGFVGRRLLGPVGVILTLDAGSVADGTIPPDVAERERQRRQPTRLAVPETQRRSNQNQNRTPVTEPAPEQEQSTEQRTAPDTQCRCSGPDGVLRAQPDRNFPARMRQVSMEIRNLRRRSPNSAQLHADIRHMGYPGDEAGHLIADTLGGPDTEANLIPLSGSVNVSRYQVMENMVREAFGRGYCRVRATITLSYADQQKKRRPTGIQYNIEFQRADDMPWEPYVSRDFRQGYAQIDNPIPLQYRRSGPKPPEIIRVNPRPAP